MVPIRTKDKVFLAVVVPTAVAAAYWHFWRSDVTRRIDALERERDALVAVGDFPVEKTQAERQLASAQEALTAERKVPMPDTKVKGNASDNVASRELTVLEILRSAGLTVTRSVVTERMESHAGSVLRATGTRPQPVCRTYEIGGRYPDFLNALRTLAARELAVIPECVGMPKPGQWTLTLWL